ncbi:hypothetical protein MMAG44476_22357 [Mycolicibacterium mageritense DSM 44476 = CIP 104973]|uniref:Secreted protein n=2 Tax=Mycolicibacterium mageritense TaxID=53462 RepID=A0AAI8XM57_MYCME|nr:hypothetical protein [Mycolicibacterium mageritense]MBN3455973.1 hypothetical protein [Mycobacterium sp. DSM 3803]OKH73490.1 hypothetical protein EB73_06990 [Mycobacterium sp. SWH-M3]MCC9180931.1 hypothetical protein [Mycolicibacterium mageritense]TXI57679.1 MAG: hypothetical protein E6Q55_25650 [Mycolicibacterium mageritense]CDO22510.1 hypothetical protein BN978_02985 [Mycolicibacterium mageritense DSM 44476 = CIP 104973]
MNRLTAASAAALLTAAALTNPASASAASNSATASIPVDPATQIEMHVDANCAGTMCTFRTSANLLGPDGPTGFPGDTWARQTITLRSMNRDVWQEASYSAPAGMPREVKGANHDNVLSRMLKSINNVEISVTYFGGGPIERFTVDGDSSPTDWSTGQPNTKADFIACSFIQVVYGGVNLTTPTACAQTTF